LNFGSRSVGSPEVAEILALALVLRKNNEGRSALLAVPLRLGFMNSMRLLSSLPLRLIVGYGFLNHGYSKLIHGPDKFAVILRGLHVPAPHIAAWMTIGVEVFGGLAVLLGAFVALFSVPMAAVLIVAIVTVHLPFGFSSVKLIAVGPTGPVLGPPGYETNLLYLACLAALVLSGPSPLSVDAYLRRRRALHTNAIAQTP
jgi:putative oxidoreductase